MLALFNERTAAQFVARFDEQLGQLDFRQYSKAQNPRLKRYDFGFEQLLR